MQHFSSRQVGQASVLLLGVLLLELVWGCAPTARRTDMRQEAARFYPGVSFQAPVPVAVSYAETQGPVGNAVRAVLREMGEDILPLDRARATVETRERALGALFDVPGLSGRSYVCRVSLASARGGTDVAMKVDVTPAASPGNGQDAVAADLVRALFFHRLNAVLTPVLLTYREADGTTFTRDAAEVLGLDMVDYTVQHNETLSIIAERYTTSIDNWEEIARVNGIADPRALTPGRTLRISRALLKPEYRASGVIRPRPPENPRTARDVPAPPQEPDCGEDGSGCIMHVVGPNESLSQIASRYTGASDNWTRIARVNHIGDPDGIVVGQAIFIPKAMLSSGADHSAGADSRRLNFLTVYPHPRPLMRRALLSVFDELGIGVLRATPTRIASTAWAHEGLRYTFNISLADKDAGTEMGLVCLASRALEDSAGHVEQTAQSWIEGTFFPALDRAIAGEHMDHGVESN